MLAAEPSLLDTLGATMLDGHFLDPVAARYPEVVLGFNAAQNLGIPELTATTQVYVADQYLTVIGILDPVATAPEMDNAALVSFPAAVARLRYDAGVTRIYLRVDPDQVAAVAAVLPFTASPATPEAVEVRRPSDILRARVAAKTAFVGVFLALGTVALTIGGVGIANTMVIAVLERRGEIGLRRALGARRSHIAVQFLIEASILAVIGGILGLALGCLGTVLGAYATNSPVVIPASAPALGLGAALVVGVLAGVYPAGRAARTEPASALRTT
jgi:putative ABC transport system permease protein